MARRPLKEDFRDELSYAVSDIRAAWERAWFSQAVTPQWHEAHAFGRASPASVPEPEPDRRAVVRASNPHVPQAIDGIGHSGGDNFNPDHTRDAVRTFYGQETRQDWRDACRNVFGESAAEAGSDDELAPDRAPRVRR